MFTPTFDSTMFICKDCGKTFFGRECDKRPKEKISTLFAERGVPADIASRYGDVVANCELHIYGVSTVSADEMRNTYNEAEDIIAKLNPLLKKKR